MGGSGIGAPNPPSGLVDRRVYEHPILKFDRGKRVRIIFDGKEIPAYENETIAAALYAAGILHFNYSGHLKRPRGPFCMIGKCSQCMMRVNGIPHVRTCITLVEDGMIVEREDVHDAELPTPAKKIKVEYVNKDYDIVVVGAGPAGLSAAMQAAKLGAKVAVLDQNPFLGGQLIKQTHKFFGTKESYAGTRGVEIAKMLVNEVKDYENVDIYPSAQAIGYYRREGVLLAFQSRRLAEYRVLRLRGKRYVIATGAMERSLVFPGNDLPGVMGAGAAQTLMNVFGIKPADEVLIIGAGNVGVIIAYQAAQAGVKVKAVIDILPKTAAYLVHASKIRRMGIPVLMRHTIREAFGKDKVEGAVIYEVDEKFRPVPGSEKELAVDGIWMAVGLTPSVELLELMGAKLKFVRELGGYVPLRTQYLETTLDGVYVAGDATGIEEASTAMMEGKIAGISAAFSLGYKADWAEKERANAIKWLDEFRSSPHYVRIKEGVQKVLITK
jgi:sarcosine oxidase subunit alpha